MANRCSGAAEFRGAIGPAHAGRGSNCQCRYGVFGLVLDGRLPSCYYQLEKNRLPLLGRADHGKPKSKERSR